MPEWPNGTDSKSVVSAMVPRVQIPIFPPYHKPKPLKLLEFRGLLLSAACKVSKKCRNYLLAGVRMNVVMDNFFQPTIWTATTLIVVLIAIVTIILGGGTEDDTREDIWIKRGAGVEISLILLPFVFYAVGNILNGSYDRFMASAELPMAAMILFTMTIFSLFRGLEAASKVNAYVEPFMVLALLAITFSFCCGAYISWLAFKDYVSLWFGFVNCLLILVAVFFSYGVHSAMMQIVRNPERLQDTKPSK